MSNVKLSWQGSKGIPWTVKEFHEDKQQQCWMNSVIRVSMQCSIICCEGTSSGTDSK